jgi:hypothetical protein
LVGHYLLHEWSPSHVALETPDPPAELSDEDLDRLKDRLSGCMPRRSMIIDLWDWDIRFEELLEDDWYFEAAFGTPDTVDECATELADLFLEQVDKWGIDYNQYEDPDGFEEMVSEEARKFVRSWREDIFKKLVQAGPTPERTT